MWEVETLPMYKKIITFCFNNPLNIAKHMKKFSHFAKTEQHTTRRSIHNNDDCGEARGKLITSCLMDTGGTSQF